MADFDPPVVLWDIGIPYEENWALLRRVCRSRAGRRRRFVLTTANKRALESLVGATSASEFVGTPHDLERLRISVRHALRPAG